MSTSASGLREPATLCGAGLHLTSRPRQRNLHPSISALWHGEVRAAPPGLGRSAWVGAARAYPCAKPRLWQACTRRASLASGGSRAVVPGEGQRSGRPALRSPARPPAAPCRPTRSRQALPTATQVTSLHVTPAGYARWIGFPTHSRKSLGTKKEVVDHAQAVTPCHARPLACCFVLFGLGPRNGRRPQRADF